MKRFVSSWLEVAPEKCWEAVLEERQVFVCVLSLPMMSAKEIMEAVRWELPLHIPFEEEGCGYAYKVLDKRDGIQQVQVFVVSKEVVGQYDDAAKEKGMVLTALRIAGESEDLNLLPDEKKRLRVSMTKLYHCGMVLMVVLGVVLLSGAWCYKEAQLGKLTEAEAKLQSLKPWQQYYDEEKKRQEQIAALTTSLQKLEQERIVWSEVLEALGNSMPDKCWLTQVKQKEASQIIEVQGKASGMIQVKKLLEKLHASKKFKTINLMETGEVKGALLSYKLLLQEGGTER